MYAVPFFFFMIRLPPTSTLFPTRRSSDLYLFGQALRILCFVYAIFELEPWSNSRFSREFLILLVYNESESLWGKQFHWADRKSTRLNSSHVRISYAVFCLKKKI